MITAHSLSGEEIFDITKELRLACCSVTSRSCSYLGVYAADQIPTLEKLLSFGSGAGNAKRMKKNDRTSQSACCYRARSFIANTDPANKPGYHWLAFIVFADHPSVIYFFDSFGMPLSSYGDVYRNCLKQEYFSEKCIVTPVNTRNLQGNHSTVCGHYCIMFLYLCARVSLEKLNSLVRQAGVALGAIRVLVHVTGGDSALDRDVSVVRVLSELLNRKEHLTPALACSHLGSAAGRRQCCQSHK
jgi:hypothetical protein